MSMTTFEMGGKEWTIPSLNARQIEELRRLGRMAKTAGVRPFSLDNFVELSGIFTSIIFTGLSRNYPSLEREELEEMLNMKNIVPIANKVMEAAGFRPLDN